MRRPPPDLPPGEGRVAAARRGERGEVTFVGILILAAVVAVGYLAWVWVPVWFVHYEAKQVVRDFMNQAVRDKNDARLVAKMVQKLQVLDAVEVPGDDGEPERVPAVLVDVRDVTWERDADADPPMLHVALDYERPVIYPLIGRVETHVMSIDLEADLAHADWGPAR
jgi:hypothetical protein